MTAVERVFGPSGDIFEWQSEVTATDRSGITKQTKTLCQKTKPVQASCTVSWRRTLESHRWKLDERLQYR